MPTYTRAEMQATIDGYIEANRKARLDRDWGRHLGPFYTDDAVYTWNIGPNEEFRATSRQQIVEWALGAQMEGFEDWSYPYDKVLIDEAQGELVGFWRQVAPVTRPDGSTYEVAGTGGSWFRYAGNGKWSWQRDFFDFGNVVALLGELAADGKLPKPVREKLHRVALGKSLPGHVELRAGGHGMLSGVRGKLALARIALLG